MKVSITQPIFIDEGSQVYRFSVGNMGMFATDSVYYVMGSGGKMKALKTLRKEIGGNYQQVKKMEILEHDWVRVPLF